MERYSVRPWFWRGVSLVCVLAIVGFGAVVLAQGPAAPPASPPSPPAHAQAAALAPQQLDDLVAPIALYPDPLLGQVLAASTYPVELVEAQQWLQANGNLQGQQLMDAARQQNWDASVQALVAMPDVLARLTRGHPLDYGSGQRFPGAAGRRDERRAAHARARPGERQAAIHPARDGDHPEPGRPVGNRNSAGQSPGDLRPDLRPLLCLGASGLGILSAALLSGLRILVRTRNRPRILFRRLGLGAAGAGAVGAGARTGSAAAYLSTTASSIAMDSTAVTVLAVDLAGESAWMHDPAHRHGRSLSEQPTQQPVRRSFASFAHGRGAVGELAHVRRRVTPGVGTRSAVARLRRAREALRAGSTSRASRATGAPHKAIGAPHKAIGAPRKATGAPRKAIGAPRKATGAPRKAIGAPRKAIGAPRKATGAPHSAPSSQRLVGPPRATAAVGVTGASAEARAASAAEAPTAAVVRAAPAVAAASTVVVATAAEGSRRSHAGRQNEASKSCPTYSELKKLSALSPCFTTRTRRRAAKASGRATWMECCAMTSGGGVADSRSSAAVNSRSRV